MTYLSEEQATALERFKNGYNLFITGAGGSGKTLLIHHLVEHAKSTGKKVQVCALTGCASILLGCSAKTIHSWSGIKLARGSIEDIVAQVSRNRQAKKKWKAVQVLIVDEVSMMSRKIFDALEAVARHTRNNPFPFGGIQVVFCGDFYQLPPIPTASEPETGEFCFESDKWATIFQPKNHIELKTIFRQTDTKYIEILSQVRVGELSQENADILKQYVKREYDDTQNNGAFLTKLFPIRSRVDYVNKMMFEKIEEPTTKCEIVKYRNCTTYLETNKQIEPAILQACRALTKQELDAELEQLMANTPCIPDLELKRGASVMCTVNLDMEKGICNGSQGIITDFIGGTPVVKFANGTTMPIGYHSWQSEDFPIVAISGFPLQLSWALTIHKIQGATLGSAQIDIGNGVFEYGQTYVALSRIKSLEGLYLSGFNPNRIKANPKVREFYDNIRQQPSLSDDVRLVQFAFKK